IERGRQLQALAAGQSTSGLSSRIQATRERRLPSSDALDQTVALDDSDRRQPARVVTGFVSWVSWPSDSSVAGFSRASAITAAIGRMPPCPPPSHKRCRAAVHEGR
ncbi:hypothetical protein, partial [Methylobacterium sp. CCH7-A2]|uniref:hypothetical protein n=1 Tax=Methylobacterium sp. CCH7-A2 TaxID=1768789 RepID=UPI001AECCEDE